VVTAARQVDHRIGEQIFATTRRLAFSAPSSHGEHRAPHAHRKRLFGSTALACAAGLLMTFDGAEFVLSARPCSTSS